MSAPYGGRPDDPDAPAPSLGELFGEVSNDLSELVRQELALAKAEATQSATRAGKGIGMFAGAALGGYFVLLFLSVAGWWGLGHAIGHAWSQTSGVVPSKVVQLMALIWLMHIDARLAL